MTLTSKLGARQPQQISFWLRLLVNITQSLRFELHRHEFKLTKCLWGYFGGLKPKTSRRLNVYIWESSRSDRCGRSFQWWVHARTVICDGFWFCFSYPRYVTILSYIFYLNTSNIYTSVIMVLSRWNWFNNELLNGIFLRILQDVCQKRRWFLRGVIEEIRKSTVRPVNMLVVFVYLPVNWWWRLCVCDRIDFRNFKRLAVSDFCVL